MSVQSVKATINGVEHTLTLNGSTGKYEATINAPSTSSYNVNAGHYYPVTIVATDDANNTTTVDDTDATFGEDARIRVVEKVKPTIAFTSPSGGAILTNNQPSIALSYSDNDSGLNLSSFTMSIDGGAAINYGAPGLTVNANTAAYVLPSALLDGMHTITASITDNDGNVSTAASVTFKVDTVPPVLSVTSPTDDLITGVASLDVIGSTNDATSSPVTVTVKLNGVDQGTVTLTDGSFSKAITLASGVNTIVVRSTDAAGKFSEVTRTVTYDNAAPVFVSVSITPNPVDAGQTYVISVEVTD